MILILSTTGTILYFSRLLINLSFRIKALLNFPRTNFSKNVFFFGNLSNMFLFYVLLVQSGSTSDKKVSKSVYIGSSKTLFNNF